MMKDDLELMLQFEAMGYVTHDCPDCDEESAPTEIDNDKAYCEVCDKQFKVRRVL